VNFYSRVSDARYCASRRGMANPTAPFIRRYEMKEERWRGRQRGKAAERSNDVISGSGWLLSSQPFYLRFMRFSLSSVAGLTYAARLTASARAVG
jgi:hypothetical protein